MHNFAAEHDYPAGIAFFAGGGKVEQKTAPYPQAALWVPFEPQAPQVHGIVEQKHVHAFAITVSGLQYRVFDGLGLPPVPDQKAGNEKPEEGSEGQGCVLLCCLCESLISINKSLLTTKNAGVLQDLARDLWECCLQQQSHLLPV